MLAALAKLGDEGPAERLLLSDVLPVAEELAAALREHPAADAVEVAGSARRRAETCKDIDLIATASDPKALAEALTEHELAAQSGSAGDGRDPDHDPQRHLGRPADRRRPTPTATCSSTSPARPRTTSTCASAR